MGNTVKTISGGLVTDTTFSKDGKEICSFTYPEKGDASDAQVMAFSYDKNGNVESTVQEPEIKDGVIKVTDDSIITGSKYDDSGREIEKTDENGKTVKYEYEDVTKSKLTKVIEPDGSVTTYNYDGVKTTTFNAEDQISQVINNDAGNPVSVGDHGKTVGDSSKIVTTYEYDSNGNVSKEIYENGDYQKSEYDDNNNLIKVSSYKAGATETQSESHYSYDKDGNLSERKDMKGNTLITHVKYEYDEFSRMIKYAESNTEMTGMPEDKTYTYEYDNVDRIIRIDYPGDKDEDLKGVKFIYEGSGSKLMQVKAVISGSIIGESDRYFVNIHMTDLEE